MSASVTFGFGSSSSANKDSNNGSSGSGGGAGSTGNPNLGSADWIRRANGTQNGNSSTGSGAGGSNTGSTTPHRRPSLSTTLTHGHSYSNSIPGGVLASSQNTFSQPNAQNQSFRYSKEQLLDVFKQQENEKGALERNIEKLLGEWASGGNESGGGAASWGRTGEEAGASGAEVCWDKNGGLRPMNLQDMDEAEKELFSGNVNSPQKVPINQNAQTGVQGNRGGNTGQKATNRRSDGDGPTTPNRLPNRRRETSDAGPGSPLHGNSPGLPGSLSRRGTGLRTSLNDSFDGSSAESRLQTFSRWGSKDNAEPEESKEKEAKDVGGRTGGLFRRPSAAWGSGTGTAPPTANAMGSFSALPTPTGTGAGGVFGGGMGGFTLLTDKKRSSGQRSKGDDQNEDNADQDSDNRDNEKDRGSNADDTRPMTSDTDPFARGSSIADSPPNYSCSQKNISRTQSPASGFDSMGIRSKASYSNLMRDQQQASASKLREEIGFSGMNTKIGGFGLGSLNTQFGQMGLGQQQQHPDNQPFSPTETNPYQSPLAEKIDEDDMDSGLGSIGGGIRRGMMDSTGNRSGKSSIAGSTAGGLGSIGSGIGPTSLSSVTGSSVWGTPGSSLMTPLAGISTGPTSASIGGGSFFGLPDLSSPANTIGGTNSPANAGFGSAGRASRLGSLFNMGDQHGQQHLQEDELHGLLNRQDSFDKLGLGTMGAGLGSAVGRRNFNSLTSGMDSPLRDRNDFDLFAGLNTSRSMAGGGPSENPLFANVQLQSGPAEQRSDPMLHQTMLHQAASHPNLQRSSLPTGMTSTPSGAQTPGGSASLSSLPQLVMPDKIQWEYRDPSGTVQGPFSGLEMHEWYKAGFFTPDLHVKRVEESEFEPLGSFVRRIGNQREPFLVPMQSLTNQGISTPAANAWGGSVTGVATPGAPTGPGWLDQQVQTPGAQPPFAGSFPSFGTTLTAEQQNALERRKQEEQYLMARQREYLMQQQVIAKQMAHQQSLHHQTSSHSLHSQSSFTSLTGQNANAFPPTPIAGAQNPNLFDQEAMLRQAAGGIGEGFTQNELQQLGQFPLGQQSQIQPFTQPSGTPSFPGQPATTHLDSQAPTAAHQHQLEEVHDEQGGQQSGAQQVNLSLSDSDIDAALGAEQGSKPDDSSLDQAQPSAQTEDQPPQVSASSVASSILASASSTAVSAPTAPSASSILNAPTAPSVIRNETQSRKVTSPKPLSLASSAWNDTSSGLPQPFPPPPSAKTELPPRTPNVETPSVSIAPWAKETESNVPKGPSLKEIQELEAKQAAAEEAAAAEARRIMGAQQAPVLAPIAPAPGLPSSATWASANASPSVSASTSASAWAKPLAKPTPTGPKKTLSQIQKEEEARKVKAAQAAAQAAAATNNAAALAGGKRYADLASKPTSAAAPVANAAGGAWLTVGASGKPKGGSIPTTAALTRPPLAPTTSLGLVKTKAPVAKPAPVVNTANDEFMKWCRASLKGLNSQVNVDDFLQSLLSFPPDAELIADSVYASSSTIDGRRFSEEFIRRKKAANTGVVVEAGAGLPGIGSSAEKAGGWNEVAKKNAAHAQQATKDVPETNSAFKVVPGKKRGKRT